MKLAGRGFELLDPWVGGVTLKRRFNALRDTPGKQPLIRFSDITKQGALRVGNNATEAPSKD